MELLVVSILSLAANLGAVVMVTLVYVLILAGNLVFGLALGTEAKRARAKRWTLRVTAGAAVLLVVALAALAAANAFFFDSLTGWVFGQLDKRAGISLTFDRAEGSLWSGRFHFRNLQARRVDHPQSVFDFRVDSAEVDISMGDLVRRKIVFDRLVVAGVDGSFEQLAKAGPGTAGQKQKGLKPKRSFVINNFDLEKVTVNYRNQTLARPLAAELKLDHLRAEAVSSRTLVADLMFRSQAAGSFEGVPFSIVNEKRSGDFYQTAWRCDNLTVGALAAMVGGPFTWFESGRVDLLVDNQSRPGREVVMDWNLIFRDFKAQTPAEASPAVKIWAAPVVAYINSKSDDLELGFSFKLSPGELEFASTEDLRDLVLKLVGDSFKDQLAALGQKVKTDTVKSLKSKARERLEQSRTNENPADQGQADQSLADQSQADQGQADQGQADQGQIDGENSSGEAKKDGRLKSFWKDRKDRKAGQAE